MMTIKSLSYIVALWMFLCSLLMTFFIGQELSSMENTHSASPEVQNSVVPIILRNLELMYTTCRTTNQ